MLKRPGHDRSNRDAAKDSDDGGSNNNEEEEEAPFQEPAASTSSSADDDDSRSNESEDYRSDDLCKEDDTGNAQAVGQKSLSRSARRQASCIFQQSRSLYQWKRKRDEMRDKQFVQPTHALNVDCYDSMIAAPRPEGNPDQDLLLVLNAMARKIALEKHGAVMMDRLNVESLVHVGIIVEELIAYHMNLLTVVAPKTTKLKRRKAAIVDAEELSTMSLEDLHTLSLDALRATCQHFGIAENSHHQKPQLIQSIWRYILKTSETTL